MLTVGSLFSGIGGLDLGLERAGMSVKWQSEIDLYACRVLKKHWPDVPNLGNIKEINWEEVEKVDVICGGYPCQPFSTAGKRNGEEDPRHLWPWVREAISELRPHYAILENVRGHLSLGGLSVIGELASIGYDAEWRIVSAASVGANHQRDRVIIVAYPDNAGGGTPERRVDCDGSEESQERQFAQFGFSGCSSDVANSDGGRREQCEPEIEQVSRAGCGCKRNGLSDADAWQDGWRFGSVQQGAGIVFGGENIGRRVAEYAGWQWWETEPDVGRVAHGIPSRVDRLRGLGNAVVPQVAEVIGRLIMEAHNERNI